MKSRHHRISATDCWFLPSTALSIKMWRWLHILRNDWQGACQDSIESHTWRAWRNPWKVLVSLISYPAKTVPTTSQPQVLHVYHLINMGNMKNRLLPVNSMKPLRKLTKRNLLSDIWMRIWKFRLGYKLNVLLKHKESISAWVFVHNICRKFHWNYIFASIIFVKVSFNRKNFKVFLEHWMLWLSRWIALQLQNNECIILEMKVEIGRIILKCVIGKYSFYIVIQGYS
jgi:hypothetical protein